MGEMELQTSGVWRSDSAAEAAGLHAGGGCLPGCQRVKRWDVSVAKKQEPGKRQIEVLFLALPDFLCYAKQGALLLGLGAVHLQQHQEQSTGECRYRQHCHSCLLWAQWQTAQISLLNIFHWCFKLLMKMRVTDNTSCALGKPTANFNHLSKLNVCTLQ